MKGILEYKAYLIDLDGTLIDLDFEKFTSEYYRLLFTKMSVYVNPVVFKEALNAGISAMLKNNGKKTNEQVFFEEFNRIVGEKSRELIPVIESFYSDDFKKLKSLACRIEEAREFISVLKKEKKKLVLATNPVFPISAIKERLSWAGIDSSAFDFITSFEVMKSCKPNPSYFKQVLEVISAKPEDTLMIGDDLELDAAAMKAGIDVVIIDKKTSAFELKKGYMKVPGFKYLLNLVKKDMYPEDSHPNS